jgi:hypothetical protein
VEIVVIDRNFSAENQDNVVDLGARRAGPAGNGKLSRELFETAGIPVAGTQPVPVDAPPPRLVRHQPSNMEIIRLGEEAMDHLVKGQSWETWIKVMRALDAGRSTAMLKANSNRPQGSRYREAFRKWLRLHPALEAIEKSDRSRFHKCFDNLDAINDWREKHVPDHQLLKLNYPPTVLKRWESWKKKQAEPRKEEGNDPDPCAPSGPKLADIWPVSSEEEKQEVLDREDRAGLAKLVSPSLLADLVDHAVAQQIASCPNMKLKTYVHGTLTKILWRIIGAAKRDDISAVFQACAGFLRKCQAINLDYRDLQITSPKKRAPKKR